MQSASYTAGDEKMKRSSQHVVIRRRRVEIRGRGDSTLRHTGNEVRQHKPNQITTTETSAHEGSGRPSTPTWGCSLWTLCFLSCRLLSARQWLKMFLWTPQRRRRRSTWRRLCICSTENFSKIIPARWIQPYPRFSNSSNLCCFIGPNTIINYW